MTCLVIDNLISCEIHCYPLLRAKNMTAAEIHRGSWAVYGQNVISEGTVRQWSRMFKDGRVNKCSQ
jgi:hypothetical protein